MIKMLGPVKAPIEPMCFFPGDMFPKSMFVPVFTSYVHSSMKKRSMESTFLKDSARQYIFSFRRADPIMETMQGQPKTTWRVHAMETTRL